MNYCVLLRNVASIRRFAESPRIKIAVSSSSKMLVQRPLRCCSCLYPRACLSAVGCLEVQRNMVSKCPTKRICHMPLARGFHEQHHQKKTSSQWCVNLLLPKHGQNVAVLLRECPEKPLRPMLCSPQRQQLSSHFWEYAVPTLAQQAALP